MAVPPGSGRLSAEDEEDGTRPIQRLTPPRVVHAAQARRFRRAPRLLDGGTGGQHERGPESQQDPAGQEGTHEAAAYHDGRGSGRGATSALRRPPGGRDQTEGASAESGGGAHRQLDHEHRPAAGPILGPEAPLVLGHHAVRDGQAEAPPLAGRLRGEEGIEDAGQVVLGNSGAVVGDLDADPVRGRAGPGWRGCPSPGRRTWPARRSAPGGRGPPGAGCCRPRSRAPRRTRSGP